MNQEQLILERDYYYKRDVTSSDQIRFATVTVAAHLVVYWYMLWTPKLKSAFDGSVLYVLIETIVSLPVATVVPYLVVRRSITSVMTKLYSLADERDKWFAKAIRLISVGEIIRFLAGLLPIPLTGFGVMTSPITYLLYTLLWINPMQKYNEIMVQRDMTGVDIAVFLVIYILYFILYEAVLLRRMKKEILRHQKHLAGCLEERRKYSGYR